jgi:hypothetical protein
MSLISEMAIKANVTEAVKSLKFTNPQTAVIKALAKKPEILALYNIKTDDSEATVLLAKEIGLTKVADNISKKDDSLLETALLMALGAMGEGNADFYKKVGEYGQEEKTRAASDLVYNQGFLNVYVESGDYAKAIELAEQNGEEAMAEGLRTIDNLLK